MRLGVSLAQEVALQGSLADSQLLVEGVEDHIPPRILERVGWQAMKRSENLGHVSLRTVGRELDKLFEFFLINLLRP